MNCLDLSCAFHCGKMKIEGKTNAVYRGWFVIALILMLSITIHVDAQQCRLIHPGTIYPKRDTLAFYKKIKKVASRHRATTYLYTIIFVDPAPQQYQKAENCENENPSSQPPACELTAGGKIIRNLRVEVLDPFGYSVNDTLRRKTNPFQALGNRYHLTTRQRIIRNILLFRENDTLLPVKIQESERLIRTTGYVNDARIYVERTGSGDSVDVKVIVQDKWGLDAFGSLGRSNAHLTVRDRNILGTGQLYEQNAMFAIDGDYRITGRYNIANISNSFVSSNIFYAVRPGIAEAGIILERPFYSPLAKWVGGMNTTGSWQKFRLNEMPDSGPQQAPLNSVISDIWIGRNIHAGSGNYFKGRLGGSAKKTRNIFIAGRFSGIHYYARPLSVISSQSHNNVYFCLASAGLSLSKFYKDQYIFRFGANEDIPEGLKIQFVSGITRQEHRGNKYYTGFEIAQAKHFYRLGYFAAYTGFGNSYSNREGNNSTLRLGFTYFTDLLKGGSWYFRFFSYAKFVAGLNKAMGEYIIIQPSELYGYNNGVVQGINKLILNFEAVAYTPYNLVGFRFAPLLFVGFGTIGTGNKDLCKSVYHSYAAGLLVRNESLLNSSFKFSVGIYPQSRFNINTWFRLNPMISYSARLMNLFNAKPEMIPYD